jgi:hypothetical protein
VAGFEAIITFGLVLMVLNLANGPKLNGPFIPLAVTARAWCALNMPVTAMLCLASVRRGLGRVVGFGARCARAQYAFRRAAEADPGRGGPAW